MDYKADTLSLARLRPDRSRRTSSFDKSGGNADYVHVGGGDTFTLLETDGPGVVRHIWITMDAKHNPLHRKDVVLRCYWDGQENPSVEAPIGDFFGNGFGQFYNFSSPYLACAPRSGRALVCYFPMPFHRHARITIENQSTHPVEHFYYYVDYDEVPALDEDVALFHAWYNQELTSPDNPSARENEWSLLHEYEKNPTDEHNYLWLETEGHGHFVGVNYYVANPGPVWYGEGDDMFMIDGHPWPDLHGTGTEDYFNTCWSPDELFQHPSFGCAYAPSRNNDDPRFGWMGRTHVYRFHQHDPIRFQKSLRASIEHGHANCLTLDLQSVAYWYQSAPTPKFPTLAPASKRHPREIPTVGDVHRWRDIARTDSNQTHYWEKKDK